MLYPAFGILLSPVIAAAAMALSSVSVIGNALRLRTLATQVGWLDMRQVETRVNKRGPNALTVGF